MTRDATIVTGLYVLAIAAAVAVGMALPDMHPIWVAAIADVVGTVVVFAGSLATRNSSMYDPYWSVAPPLIAAYFLLLPARGLVDPVRVALVLMVVTLWAVRLTYNWARQWRGMSHEDWRYVMLAEQTGRAYWLVSFLGIHLFPTIQVFLGCLALWPALNAGARPLNALDVVAAVAGLTAVWFEATADKQLHRFVHSDREPDAILGDGLWAWSRHPNYFGEVLFWWALFAFAMAAQPQAWWTGTGALTITLMFLFISIPMIERRMVAKRPHYVDHKRRVSMLLPLPPRKRAS